MGTVPVAARCPSCRTGARPAAPTMTWPAAAAPPPGRVFRSTAFAFLDDVKEVLHAVKCEGAGAACQNRSWPAERCLAAPSRDSFQQRGGGRGATPAASPRPCPEPTRLLPASSAHSSPARPPRAFFPSGYLAFLLLIVAGFSTAFHILFRRDQAEHEVSAGRRGLAEDLHRGLAEDL